MKLQVRLIVLTGVVCTSFLTGCSQTSSLLNFNKVPVASAKDPVFEIMGIWEPSEGQGPDGKSRRGCAGQILFMTRGKKSPVKVNGEITVLQFDDFGTAEEQARPIHTFKFDDAAWNKHFGDGALGPSYSVFIPYMGDTNFETICALRIKFTSDDGRETSSAIAKINLPGTDRKKASTRGADRSDRVDVAATVRRQSYTKPKREMGEHIANVDRGRLRPIGDTSHRKNSTSRLVQQASYEESADDDDAAINAAADAKIAELEAKLARIKKAKVSDVKASDRRSILMNRSRFPSASDKGEPFRKAGSYGPPPTDY